MMTEYHIRGLKRAQDIEKRGRQLFGEDWKPSRWHVSLILKAEADVRNRTEVRKMPSNKRFSRGWRTQRNKRNRLKQKKINVDK
jgi:hypothetical protein